MKQRGALCAGIFLRQLLKGIPDHPIRVRELFHWEIAFEHTPVRTEFFDAPFEVRLQNAGELFR